MPNLIEIQKDSYQWFLDEGLKEAFDDISPITDFAGHLSLEFVDFTLCKDDVKYTIEECKERDATYAAPLKVKVRLYNKDKDEMNEHEIFMGDLPLMTDTGSFVINGAERVIVSQLVRSPGIYYGIGHDKVGKELFTCTVIPNRGAWLEYETDSNDVFYVRVDRTRKVPVTVLVRALGYGTNAEILDLFGEEPKLLASFGKDTSDNYQDGLLELYKKIRPGEPLSVDSAESLLNSMFFDPRRYDLAKVGRYKFNKKLSFKNRLNGQTLAEDVVDTIADMGPERVVYVSCDPGTLGRDVKRFAGRGYTLKKAVAVDMFPRTAHVETVVLLSKGEVDSKKIRVEFSLEDMDMSEFQDGATYTQIKDYVLEHSGLKVSNLYISQIKRKCGIEVGKNYNLPKSEDSRQPMCPPEKEKAIREAFKYFGMI